MSFSYVQLVDIAKHFGKVKALDGLTLDIAKGEFVALLGPSGCGKTTALRALAGLQGLDRGQIIVDGKDITYTAANKRNMGMVFQAYSLFPHMTARENVEYGLKLKAHKTSTDKRKARSAELLELVGLSTHANHYPHQLSGGQQQRLCIARALAVEPSVLLMDEPTSALDENTKPIVQRMLEHIIKNKTTIMITHDQFLYKLADNIYELKDGKFILENKKT